MTRLRNPSASRGHEDLHVEDGRAAFSTGQTLCDRRRATQGDGPKPEHLWAGEHRKSKLSELDSTDMLARGWGTLCCESWAARATVAALKLRMRSSWVVALQAHPSSPTPRSRA